MNVDPRRLLSFDALVLTSAIWFLAKFFRYAFPPLYPTFQADFGVSNTLLGTAFSAMMLVYAVMQFPSGALADRFGSVRIIAAGLVITAASGFLLAIEGPLPILLVGMLLVGIGTGAHKTVAIRLLSTVYPERTGRTLGIFDTIGALGGAVAPIVVVAILDVSGWRSFFLLGAVVGVAFLAAFVRRVPRRLPADDTSTADAARDPENPDDSTDEDGDGNEDADGNEDREGDGNEDREGDGNEDREGDGNEDADEDEGGNGDEARNTGWTSQYAVLFRDPTFVTFVAVTALVGFAHNGLAAFLPLYLVDVTGLTPTTANLLYSVFFFVSVVQVLTGDLGDRFGQRLVMLLTLVIATAGTGALLVASGPAVAGLAVLAVGFGSHGFRPVRGAYLVKVVPDSMVGGSLGIVRTILTGAGFVSPAIVGLMSDTVGFVPAFALLAVAMGGGAGAAALLSRLE
jgi:MFS family permease